MALFLSPGLLILQLPRMTEAKFAKNEKVTLISETIYHLMVDLRLG